MFTTTAYGIVRAVTRGLIFSSVLLCGACSDVAVKAPETTVYVMEPKVVSRPAPIPPGVVRYCWEEPIVEFEPNGPGVDSDGHWYHKGYQAIREVRQGRWRPCQPVASETAGGLRQ